MKTSLLFQNPAKIQKTSDGHIQIHHMQNHWVVSHLSQDEVYIYDSLNPTSISKELQEQVQLLYTKKTAAFTINVVHVHKQQNLVDCGLHAIANATALAFGEAPEENVYDEGEMRTHLIACFEAQMLLPFPTRSRARRKRKPICILCT